jgi:TonB-linked SusC/RagA family outer membrane protein
MLIRVLLKPPQLNGGGLTKTIRIMKLTCILLTTVLLHAFGGTIAQKVTIHAKNATLETVFKSIEQQTGYTFFYKSDLLEKGHRVTGELIEGSLQKALDLCFFKQPFTYSIHGKIIAIKPEPYSIPGVLNVSIEQPLMRVISGVITNSETKEPLAGATISIKGASTAVTSDNKGYFEINAEPGQVLIISYIGFTPKEINVPEGPQPLSIRLDPVVNNLNEILVTGYTTQRKRDLTGAVTVVDVENMNKQPTSQVNNQLQGQAAGVTVIGSGQPGEEPQVRIRGINTFGDNTPLYVIDGVPTQNISDLNPNDVASLQILKDAGAASIYGSRASNGVIIITTKKGKSGQPVVSYDGYFGMQQPIQGNVFHILNPQEMAQLKFNALANSGTPVNESAADVLYGAGPNPVLPDYIYPFAAKEGDPSVDPSLYFINPNYTDPEELNSFYHITRANKEGTDWYHKVFNNAPITSNNINVSGATDKAKYLMSFNYFDQQGTLIKTYLKRYTIRSNTSFQVSKNIRVGENLSYTISHNPKIDALQAYSAVSYTFREQPIIPVYDIMGNYGGNYGGKLGDAHNAVATQERTSNDKGQDNRLFGNLFVDVDFMKYFTFHSSFGGENYSGHSRSFAYPTYEDQENSLTNAYSEDSYSGYSWTWTNTLSYHRNFNKGYDLQVLVGTEAYDARSQTLGGKSYGYLSFDPDYTTLSSGSGPVTNYSTRYSEGLWSQFARLDYGFRDKYLLSGTIRRDGSSKFQTYQYGWFPAVTAAWRISEESFMENVSWITDLKIRGGFGVMGNQINLGADNAYYTYTQNKNSSYYDITGTNNSIQQGFQIGQIGNPDAKWEKDANANIGIDASLFKGALNISADYYQKNISDLLYNPELPGTYGRGTVPYRNVAEAKNKGVDITVNGKTKIAKDLIFDATLTFTSYNNRITKVTDNIDYFFSGDGRQFGTPFIRNQVGHPVGAFYGYQIAGFWNSEEEIANADLEAQHATNTDDAVYQTDAGVGRFKYKDVNGDGQIDADDRTFIGNPSPDFNYGINLGFNYKHFDLSLFLYGAQGNQIWNEVKWWTDFYNSFGGGKSQTALYDSWTPDHQNAKAPIQEDAGFASTNGSPNSYYIENGSYLRAKNIILGYTFPKSILKNSGIDHFRIYIQAVNLFTLTNYSGADPEINGNGVTEFGIDEGSYPSTKQFIVGINLKF